MKPCRLANIYRRFGWAFFFMCAVQCPVECLDLEDGGKASAKVLCLLTDRHIVVCQETRCFISTAVMTTRLAQEYIYTLRRLTQPLRGWNDEIKVSIAGISSECVTWIWWCFFNDVDKRLRDVGRWVSVRKLNISLYDFDGCLPSFRALNSDMIASVRALYGSSFTIIPPYWQHMTCAVENALLNKWRLFESHNSG